MKRYKVKNKVTGAITNQWTDDQFGPDHYESCFGLPERPEIGDDGEPTGVILPAEYEITEEDLTAEIAAEKLKLESRKAKAQELVGLKGKKLTVAEAVRAIELLIDANADSLFDSISAALVRNQIQAKSK